MAKKVTVVTKQEVPAPSEKTKALVEAIVTVRNLQDFITDRGGLETALGTVTRVGDLVAMTGGFAELKAALEIVGREAAPSEG
jgi:hypothetical protein